MKKISIKIIFLALIPTMIVGITIGIMIFYMTTSSDKSSLFAYEKTMRNNFDTTAQREIQTVLTMLDVVLGNYFEKKYSLDSAKIISAELIRGLKYGKDGYFWVDSTDGTNIVSSIRTFEGKNRIGLKDSDGKFIVKEFIRQGKKGGGFLDYRFPKIVGGKPLPKRSYVKIYEPFGWIIGTGNHIDDIDEAVDLMKNAQTEYLIKMLFIIICLLFVASAFIIFIGKRMTKPLIRLSDKASMLSSGNLNVIIKKESSDEIGILAEAIKMMTEKLKEIIGKITLQAGKTANTSEKFHSASELMANGANSLATATEEVAGSVEEMLASIMQNSQNAQVTKNISEMLAKTIYKSSNNVQQTADALKIIIKKNAVINEIAAKTNILALNATVESAKAGKYGKSFAVIASAIRNLADDSRTAADRIDDLSNTGIEIADKSVNSLKKAVEEISKTVDLINNINTTSSEQEEGANQINIEITQLNQLSQQNALISQETEFNSVELSEQAKELINLTSFFKIENK